MMTEWIICKVIRNQCMTSGSTGMNMSGNTLLITGGGTGIGRSLAAAFHALGNKVIIAGRRLSVLQETAAAYPGMSYAVLDIEDRKAIESFAAKLIVNHPDLNGVIHSAGVMHNEDLLAPQIVLDDAEATVGINLLGPIRLTAALLPHLRKQKSAAILTVSSGLAFLPLAMTPTYCATKAAIHSYTQSLRYQLKDTPVQVIEIVPPYVRTELMGKRQANDPAAMPLDDYIAETMHLLASLPEAPEILVENVKPLRYAEVNGGYEDVFIQRNDAIKAARS
jgi:uncharacterized oxidoreductase